MKIIRFNKNDKNYSIVKSDNRMERLRVRINY